MKVQFLPGAPNKTNWRGGREVEGAALEKLYWGNLVVGSNPTLSAFFPVAQRKRLSPNPLSGLIFIRPHSSTDRVAVSGTVDDRSIRSGGTKRTTLSLPGETYQKAISPLFPKTYPRASRKVNTLSLPSPHS